MLIALLFACGSGSWEVETWGEEYIEDQLPADIFADACSVDYSAFRVIFTERSLVDGDGKAVGSLEGAEVYDLVEPGPSSMGTVDVAAGHYSEVYARIAPSGNATAATASAEDTSTMTGNGWSVWATGTLSCPDSTVSFDWGFATDTLYQCEPEDLTIPGGGSDVSQLTVHGDHLFYDGLENPDAEVRGLAIAAADTNTDGIVSAEELDAVSVATLGYDVGQYSDVSSLWDFVEFLTQTLGHIDGEGHCQVDL